MAFAISRHISAAILTRLAIGLALLIAGAGIIGFTAFHNNPKRQDPLVFSSNTMLEAIWHNYKLGFIEADSGRTIDKQRDNITTSEGESYTMLRAVYRDDKATFDRSWKFTKDNLQHKTDHLFGYLYGKQQDGKYGLLLDKGGDHSASDADSDIALALALGYQRWQQNSYLEDAKPIISDMWEREVIQVKGRPVLAADNLEKAANGKIVVNPSYFSPYAYRLFQVIDRKHNWTGLIDNSYSVLDASIDSPLNTGSTRGLPPNWVLMDRATGALSASTDSNLDTNYGYDALRVPWRLGLDYEWNKEPRALATLKKMVFLGDQWRVNHQLLATYKHSGEVVGNYESPAMYGGSVGYFIAVDPTEAENLSKNKLELLYDTNKLAWKSELSYYDDNWAWFGLALKNHQIPNLGANLMKNMK